MDKKPLLNEPIAYDSPSAIQEFCQKLGIAPRKFFGQNFLINRGVRQKIIHLLDLCNSDDLWEIGPGIGAMTALALPQVGSLKVFEIDHAYQDILLQFFGSSTHFDLVRGDVLKTFTQQKPAGKMKILGNLPYNISAAIIQQFLHHSIDLAVILVQKELAMRMNSLPRQKSYSSFSVWSQAHFHMSTHGTVKPHSFYPVPRVDSMIVKLIPTNALDAQETLVLDRLLRTCFGSRRKTLKNNLLGKNHSLIQDYGEEAIKKACEIAQIDLGARAEEFTCQQYISCVRYLLSSGSSDLS